MKSPFRNHSTPDQDFGFACRDLRTACLSGAESRMLAGTRDQSACCDSRGECLPGHESRVLSGTREQSACQDTRAECLLGHGAESHIQTPTPTTMMTTDLSKSENTTTSDPRRARLTTDHPPVNKYVTTTTCKTRTRRPERINYVSS